MLSLKDDAISNKSLTFSDRHDYEKIGTGWKTFFKNEDEENCPVTSCSLRHGLKCEKDYSGKAIKLRGFQIFA